MAIGNNFTFTKPNFGANPITFLKEARAELLKVNWPCRKDLIQLTLVVIGVSIGAGLYLGGLDFMFTKLLEIFLSKR